jgi:hypothetical protein
MRVIQSLLACLVAVGMMAIASTARANVLITIDKSAQSMSVSVDGMTRWIWPVSTGRSGYATPSGSFQPFRMEATHFSKEWDDAPMPHSIFFTQIGHAIHGTYEVSYLGTAVSHGCVRLSTANAAQLYQLVKQEGLPNTKIVVTGQQLYGQPEAYNSSRGRGQNWFGQNSYGQGSNSQGSYGQSQTSYGQGFFGRNPSPSAYGSQPSYGRAEFFPLFGPRD